MRCFSCRSETTLEAGERVGFRDECAHCGVDLHVCLNCRHHDAAAYNECRESSAERVRDRDRANRCEYFAPVEAGADAPGSEAKGALSDLEALFKKD